MNFVAKPDSLYLFAVTAKSDTSPSWSGQVTLSKELIQKIVDCQVRDEPCRLSVTLWNRNGNRGPFLSGMVAEYVQYVPSLKHEPREEEDDVPF